MTDQPSYLARLNPEQHRAATQIDGSLLILAGAGSGKTGVLTARIAWMLQNGISAENLFAVTFTNKAAHEMKERVINFCGEAGKKVWISTFHSSCARILRQDIEPLGWTQRFAIYDNDDQLRIIKEIIAQLGYDPERVVAKDLLSQIDHHKNRLAGSADELVQQRRSHLNDPLVRIWREYSDRLKAADAVDFNDLIRLTILLFSTQPEILEKWQNKFHYLLVDEYQDTNKAQYTLLKLLSAKRRNLAVVGDDDQSIYGFRGADISNILGFKEDFPEASIIRLEQNYRCTKNILAIANAVVKVNTGRMEKELWTNGDVGEKVTFIVCSNPKEEAERVARAITKLHRSGYDYGEMAVIYRTNATSRVFEAALRDLRLPYKIVGGRKFYEHREIRDVLSYLRLVVNPADDAAFLRVVNVPSRGIGPKALQGLRDESISRGEPLLSASAGKVNATAAGKAIGNFLSLIEEFSTAAKTEEPPFLVQRVLERTGYRAMLEAENTPEARGRLENLDELVRDTATYEPPPEAISPMERLRSWLDAVALRGQDEDIPDGGEVTLMTVHNSKGLEYPVVFVVHMMEGQFPHTRSMDTVHEVEEERRLAYVAFTRAKKRLVITRSQTIFGGLRSDGFGAMAPKPANPSRFLFGIPIEVCEGDLPRGEPEELVPDDEIPRMGEDGRERLRVFVERNRPKPVEAPRPESYTVIEIEDPSQIRTGVRVLHHRFGVGTVRARSNVRDVLVSFDGQRLPMTVRADGLQLIRD